METQEFGRRKVEPSASSVRDQLERILADPMFLSSARYPLFLRYVVERTLQGKGEELKERTLGTEIFEREPDYDTNLDNVVRVVASEVRKKLLAYYQQPAHGTELRIELRPGSYVPRFEGPVSEPHPVSEVRSNRRRTWLAVAASAGLAICLGIVGWSTRRSPDAALDSFWRPLLASSDSVLLCLESEKILRSSIPSGTVMKEGQDAASRSLAPNPGRIIEMAFLHDAIAVTRLAVFLRDHHKKYRIRSMGSTTITDLKEGPTVFIGPLSDPWSLRATSQMRFSFRSDESGTVRWIADRQNPEQKEWKYDTEIPGRAESDDYALISRLLDPTSGTVTLVAGGLKDYGTRAAGEFLTDPSQFEALAKKLGRGDLARQNIQLVIKIRVINGAPGRAQILATDFR
jgi:hypothetical protein